MQELKEGLRLLLDKELDNLKKGIAAREDNTSTAASDFLRLLTYGTKYLNGERDEYMERYFEILRAKRDY